jgi:NYN domain
LPWIKRPIHSSLIQARRKASRVIRAAFSANFGVRRGEVVAHGWKLGGRAFENMMKSPRAPAANDIVPDLEQKGVDLRIGLDIARLALRQMVDIIVVVTGDSDLVPAFRFARREGVRVILDHLGHGVRRELKAHADIVI